MCSKRFGEREFYFVKDLLKRDTQRKYSNSFEEFKEPTWK